MSEGLEHSGGSTVESIGERLDLVQQNVEMITTQASTQHEQLLHAPNQLDHVIDRLREVTGTAGLLGSCCSNIATHIDLTQRAGDALNLGATTLGTSNQERATNVVQALHQLLEGQEQLTTQVSVDAPPHRHLRNALNSLTDAIASLEALKQHGVTPLLTLTDKVFAAGNAASASITEYKENL